MSTRPSSPEDPETGPARAAPAQRSSGALAPAIRARIEALAAMHQLEPAAAERLARLTHALTTPAAPTTVHDPAAIVDVHLADSLAGLAVPELRGAGRIADVGSGAGLPGLALAAALPQVEVDLIESVNRKCTFMAGAAADMGATNARIVDARVEEWDAGRDACDVVTARAVAPLAVLAEYAAPLLAHDGVLVAWKGRVERGEELAGARAAQELGLRPEPPIPVSPTGDTREKRLQLYRKVSATPGRFPRRPGRARKAPLGT